MNIVLKWNFRTLFSDVPRLILTVCSIAVTFTLLTSMGVTLGSFVLATDSPGNSLPGTLNAVVSPVILAAFAVTVYALFAVSLAERKNQYHIMSTAGCTTRQLLKGLMAEAFTLDLTGAALGVGLGYLLAALQLRVGGYQLIPSVIFQSNVLLLNLLPALLLPPCMMLLASLQLFLPQRDRRRKRPPRRKKAVFSRSLPRLFGAGGSLEYALEHNERRHHTALVLSLAVNLAVVILATACIYMLSNVKPNTDDYDVWLWYNSAGWTDENAENEKALSESVDKLISEELQNKGISEYSEITQSGGTFCMIMDNAQLNDEVFAFRRSSSKEKMLSFQNNTVFPLDENRQLLICQLVFMDDALFERFKEDCEIDADRDGAVFVNYGAVCNHTIEPLRAQESTSLSLQFFPRSVTEKAGVYGLNGTFDPSPFLAVPPEKISTVEIPLIGTVSYNLQMIQDYFCMVLGDQSLVIPMRLRDTLLPDVDMGTRLRFSRVKTSEPEAFYLRLKECLSGFPDIAVLENRFASCVMQTDSNVPNSATDGKVPGIVINNVRALENEYGLFLRQVTRFYQVILLLVLLAIGLNIVNTVHMNRLSRRREYAILSSIGLDRRQRRGMLLFESARFFVKGIFFAVLLAPTAGTPLWILLQKQIAIETLQQQWDNLIDTALDSADPIIYALQLAWNYIVNIAHILAEYRWIVLGVVCFLFFGFLLAEHLVMNRMERDDLVVTLKDDMRE